MIVTRACAQPTEGQEDEAVGTVSAAALAKARFTSRFTNFVKRIQASVSSVGRAKHCVPLNSIVREGPLPDFAGLSLEKVLKVCLGADSQNSCVGVRLVFWAC